MSLTEDVIPFLLRPKFKILIKDCHDWDTWLDATINVLLLFSEKNQLVLNWHNSSASITWNILTNVRVVVFFFTTWLLKR